MISIREITTEEALVESEWLDGMPAWWQMADKSINKFTRGPKTLLGVFNDGIGYRDDLVAIYTLQEIRKGVIDAHLSCQRGTAPEIIINTAMAIKRKLLSSGYTIFLWPLRQNFGLIGIARMCGFKPTGVRMLMGKLGNRPAEWIQLGVSNE